jgi:hypothetical protein
MELKKVQLIIYTTVIFCLVHSCSNRTPGHIGEKPVIRINEFEVTGDKFSEEFNRIITLRKGMANNEAALLLFDNFLSLGILTESLSLDDYTENNYKKFNELRRGLLVELAIGRNLEKYGGVSFSDKEIKKIYSKNILVDYIRIPIDEKKISSLIYNKLKSGSSMDVLLNQPEKAEWDNMGLSFYVKAPVESLLLPKKVLDGIAKMNENDVRIIKTDKAFHVVHVFKKLRRINEYVDKEELGLNLKKAYALEDGEFFFDDYLCQNLIDFNNKLISNVDFTFPSTGLDSVQSRDLVATIGSRVFSKNDIVNIVNKLPVKVQSLFKNKSTRIDAVATLVLLINNHFEKEMKYLEVPDVSGQYQNYFIKQLKKNTPDDTVSFLKEWIKNKTSQFDTNSIPAIIEKEMGLKKKFDNEEKCSRQPTFSSLILPSDYYSIEAWFHPDKLMWEELLSLNYKTIESNEFVPEKTHEKNKIIARLGNWSLTTENLNVELSQLTPETRMDISQNDNLIKMINYLVCEANGKDDNISINYPALKDIDVIGYSLDSLNDTFNENSVLASFEDIKVTVGELREIVNDFSLREKQQFIDYNSQKTNIISDEIFNRYWLSRIDMESYENEKTYKSKLKQQEKFIAAKELYNSQISVKAMSIENRKLNGQFQKAVDMVNQERLMGYLLKQSDKLKIEVDKALLENHYKLNTEHSIFGKKLQLIEN